MDQPAASRVKKSRQGRMLLFSDSCKFSTEEIMGAQNFNFASKLPHNGTFQTHISGQKFSDMKNFPTVQNLE